MIVKIRNKSHFVQINNAVLRDKRLSLDARGALAEILTYSEDFDTSIGSLMSLWQIGRDRLLKITNQLKEFGYLEIVNVRDEKGKIIDKDWIFYGESQAQDFRTANKTGKTDVIQDTENTDDGEPTQDTALSNVGENQHTENTDDLLKRNSSQKEKFKSEEEEKESESTHARDISTENEFVETFNEFFPALKLSASQRETIAQRIRDGTVWRRALVYWATNDYRAQSVGKICDKYDEIFNDSQPGETQSGHTRKLQGRAGSAERTRNTIRLEDELEREARAELARRKTLPGERDENNQEVNLTG